MVARYREDMSWLERFRSLPTIVYDKSGGPANYPLPNVGREAHTYLHHIVENYDRLAEVTVFLQGNPYFHVPDLHNKIWDLPRNVGFRDLCDHILVEDGCGLPVHPGLCTNEFFEALFGQSGPDYFICHSAACFAVSQENIHQHPRSFYERALQLVVNRPLGAWEIERLWQYIFRTQVLRQGIVSAADAAFFRDLQLLVRSHQQHDRFPMVVIDLGMHPEQREWCLDAGVAVQALPQIYKPVERIKQRHWWQTWLKPFYIFHAPFDRVLWIDADCVITSDIAQAFDELAQSPLLVRDATNVETQNPLRLYDYLPLPPGCQTHGVRINAGVVGLCKIRDVALLNTWGYGVAWASLNPDKQHLSAWADQGMLLWAVIRAGHADTIRHDLHWNQPADRSPNLIASAVQNGTSVLDSIRARHPQAHIVHWLGRHKLAEQLNDELERLFVTGFIKHEFR